MSRKEIIKVRNITRDYVMGENIIHVLRGIDLTVEQGEFVAIMGPSGSGKSTLMNTLGFLDTPTTGDYWLDGVHMQSVADSDLALIRNKKIGFVFQQFHLLPRLSALENVELPLIYGGLKDPEERRRRARESLESVGLGDKLENKPTELSGGQQQRVSVARALVCNPAMILADEPTGALDSKTTEEVLEIMDTIHKEGRTIVMITHEQDVADRAERTVHIRDGLLYNE